MMEKAQVKCPLSLEDTRAKQPLQPTFCYDGGYAGSVRRLLY